jgi:hypothetical protein
VYYMYRMFVGISVHIVEVEVEVEVTLRPTVSRPVRLGVLPLLEHVTRCYIYLGDNYFHYFSCKAPSLTRGRVCNSQFNDASSISSYNGMHSLRRCYTQIRTYPKHERVSITAETGAVICIAVVVARCNGR